MEERKKRRVKARANGTGTARKRGPTWTSVVVVGWRPSKDGSHKVPIYRTKGGFTSRKEALNHCSTLLNQVAGKKIAPNLTSYWNTYKDGEMLKLSDSKQTAYKIAWGRLADISLRKVDTLTVADLRSIVDEKTKTYYPARDMKVLLGHLFDLAGADGWVNRDLPDYIILPEKDEKERTPFTEDEQKKLWKAYENGCADTAIPLIMIYTGMMTGEMRQLRTDMINFDEKKIVGVGLKTAVRKASAVYLSESIIPVLQAVSDGKEGLLWPCSENDFYERYYAALETAGTRRLTPYSCRHTTATALAITENVAPQTVKKLMRWSTSKMLDRYAHPDDKDAQEAINKL